MGEAENPALSNSDVTDIEKFHKVDEIVEYLLRSHGSTCHCTLLRERARARERERERSLLTIKK
jgi:hypothetical protein